MTELAISIVIPSYNRGQVLLDTISYLSALEPRAAEIIVIDQTVSYSKNIHEQLQEWHKKNAIKWIRRSEPSVVKAMNCGLLLAKCNAVLFLDDDIKPFDDLLIRHYEYFTQEDCSLIAGRVVQPWDKPEGLPNNSSSEFSFNGLNSCTAEYFIGANFLVDRRAALAVGGFDENFIGAAHDYEREFSDRLIGAEYRIAYCGAAAVLHLKEPVGGIRTYGHFLKNVKPHHAFGSYYYILVSKLVTNKTARIILHAIKRVSTRTHLKQPWWIPLTLIGDFLGLLWALKRKVAGQALINYDEL